MQVVIEIDDDLYVRLFDNGGNNVMDMRKACVAIRKGTPLDNLRAEIRKHCERYMDGDIIVDEVMQAVENIGKEESEG